MKKLNQFIQLVFIFSAILLITSCNENTSSGEKSVSNSENNLSSINEENNIGECNFDDNTYSATVDYNNSETGYSATYTLDVEVSDCQIVQINFSNDGYLDEDHITAADLDENGNASVEGENGKSYEVHIDN